MTYLRKEFGHLFSPSLNCKTGALFQWSLDNSASQSVNKNPWEAFGANVTAWRYHLGLLALGTANGRMAVYHARDKNQFDERALLKS